MKRREIFPTLVAPLAPAAAAEKPFTGPEERVSLNGTWQFRLDPEGAGEAGQWRLPEAATAGWAEVTVPHTWQIRPESPAYFGVAWYRRTFEAPRNWAGSVARIVFEAVFHTAQVWVNGRAAGEHTGKGYTAFTLDITEAVRFGEPNVIAVRVDNGFNERMLPRGRSSDWTHDGGIYRPVTLLVTPRTFIERVDIDAVPDLGTGRATLEITAVARNAGAREWRGTLGFRVLDERSGATVWRQSAVATGVLPAGSRRTIALPPATLPNAKLWHFDHPHLYKLEVDLEGPGPAVHTRRTTFGVRSFEVKDGSFYLNGERVRLMGVERMAGSNPEYGMAEPEAWLRHDHDDLKELNCVFTRVHWQQDQRVLDYCDRRGILMQLEVPAWGPQTFKGMGKTPDAEILRNGLEQLREMIEQNRNHPAVFAWGLCNEIGGQNPPAYEFARRMYEEARKLDPRRPRTYASHSLRTTPERDVSGLMDFVSWNQYYGSWQKGTPADVRRNLEEIHQAFPGKAIVVSEYGYCACTADRPEGDAQRIDVLREHTRVLREAPYVAGLIFFCYNDYRTHIGDKGTGVMKQRVHGVVDLYGARKPSFEELRRESSPVASFEIQAGAGMLTATVATRKDVPAYTLEGYVLRAVVSGPGGIPLERHEARLPRLDPGQRVTVPIRYQEKSPVRIQLDVLRPTGFSALTRIWTP